MEKKEMYILKSSTKKTDMIFLQDDGLQEQNNLKREFYRYRYIDVVIRSVEHDFYQISMHLTAMLCINTSTNRRLISVGIG